MPAIETTGKPLDKILQDVLNTEPNKWNYFFDRPSLIMEIFEKLSKQVQDQNFFAIDYSINTFLDFLTSYIGKELKNKDLKTINSGVLKAFNQLLQSLQKQITRHKTGFDESQQEIVSHYIKFLTQLMRHDYRDLFARSEITLTSHNIQEIGNMLAVNSKSINAHLIDEYISLLKFSFDVPEILVKYDIGLNILPLAKACFLNKAINIHVVASQFFYVLGYQGQLLDYYQSSSEYGITESFLSVSTKNLINQAIELQKYFFDHQRHYRQEIQQELLQHYLLKRFFEIIYKKYPDRIAGLKGSQYSSFLKFDYVALPNSMKCRSFPTDYVVYIEYDKLPAGVPEMACDAIKCSRESFESWVKNLNVKLKKNKSILFFRIINSYDDYPMTYTYGHAPTGSGFYISKGILNGIVNGEAYIYWGNDKHNFIEVTRHEARHHDNFLLTTEASRANPKIIGITVKSPNEGIAVNANGPCAPGFIDQNFNTTTAPSLSNLLEESFIGYLRSWLYTNYLIQEHPHFYHDILTLDKEKFKKQWRPILIDYERHFFRWLGDLKQACRNAPKELSVENCPCTYLKDCPSVTRQIVSKPQATVTFDHAVPSKPIFYNDYLYLVHAIYAKNVTEIARIFHYTNYSSEIVNYGHPERGFETPLHYLFASSGESCSAPIVQILCDFGAIPLIRDDQNNTPYAMARDCRNGEDIKAIFDKKLKNRPKQVCANECGLGVYQQEKLLITVSIPISSFFLGAVAGAWRVAEGNSAQHRYLSPIITYGLEPLSLALASAMMNSLLIGSAESISLENIWLSTVYYLGVNYVGLVIAQLGEQVTKKIQNKLLNLFVSILLYTFFLNPTLLTELMSEGLNSGSFSKLVMPLLSMLSSGLFFKAGEWSTKKIIEKCSPKLAEGYTPCRQDEESKDPNPSQDLMKFEKNITHLVALFEPMLKTSEYPIFESDLNALKDVSKLKDQEKIDKNEANFKEAKASITRIKNNVDAQKAIPNKKKILKHIIGGVLPAMGAIRPLPTPHSKVRFFKTNPSTRGGTQHEKRNDVRIDPM